MEESIIDNEVEVLLRESKEHFHDLFENIMEGVAFCHMIFDDSDNPVDWIYLYVNRAFVSLTGLENIVGMHVTEAIPGIKESSSDLFAIYGRVASTGQQESFESEVPSLSRWFKISVYSPVKNYFVAIFENITECKRTKEDLRKSEEPSMMLADLLEKSSQPFAARFMDGRISVCNNAFCNLVGYSKEELNELDSRKLTPPEWSDLDRSFLRQLENTGEPVRYEKEYVRKDGSRVPVELLAHLIQDKAGRPEQYYAFSTDITERKMMEQELQLKDFAFKSSITPEAIANMEGFVTYANESFVKTWGYDSIDEVIGKRNSDFRATPSEGKVVIDAMKETGLWAGEYVAKKKDGSTFIALAQNSPVLDKEGNQIALYTSVIDITDRKKAEENLAESERKFSNFVSNVPVGVFTTTIDGKIMYVNDALVKMFEFKSAKEFIAYSAVANYKNPADREAFFGMLKKNGIAGLFETEMITQTGKSIIVLMSAILEGNNSTGMIIDISAQKRAEAALKKVLQDLSRSNRDLEQFAYIASHDLQEPLRMISSYVKLIERRYKGMLDADADDFINFAVDGAVRMQNLINDLLLYSRVHTRGKEFEFTNLEDVFATATNNLNLQIEDNQAIITHDPLPKLMVDRVQIIQVFQNLISNGIKFHREEDAPRVHVSAKENDDEWTVSVQDNGIGIEPQYFNRLFIIFQRLNEKDKYPGTGIGLAICKRIIERHGGRIWLESEPGIGSTFYFSILKNLKNDANTIEEKILDGI